MSERSTQKKKKKTDTETYSSSQLTDRIVALKL